LEHPDIDVNLRSYGVHGKVPLYVAIGNRNFGCVEALLDNKRKKVDVNQKCGINMHTPMHFAIEMNSPRIRPESCIKCQLPDHSFRPFYHSLPKYRYRLLPTSLNLIREISLTK
jgi:hypothetical protein